MADSTLRDVIKSIKTEGGERASADDRTHELLLAIDKRFADYFKDLQRSKLDDLEDKLEKKKAKAKAGTSKPGKGGFDLSFLGGLGIGALAGAVAKLAALTGTFAGLTAGFVGATEGLGVYKTDLVKFKTAMTGFMKPLNGLTKLMDDTTAKLLRGLGLMDAGDDPRGPGQRGVRATLADKAKARWNRFTLGLLNSLGIGPDGKAIQLRDAKGAFGPKSEFGKKLEKALNKFSDIFGKLKEFGKSIAAYFSSGGPQGQGQGAGSKILQSIANFKPLVIVARILRPLAILFAVFDGMRNASKEMEDKEGYINKYLGGGVGGAISGAVGSFFGEFFNLIKAIPMFIIKKVVPANWIDKETGEFKKAEGILPFLLGGVDDFDFARVIRDIIQRPFDLISSSLQYISDLVGFGGEDKQAEAKGIFDKWWNTTSWGEKGLDILGAIVNTVFSPITAVIAELETAFLGTDSETAQNESFVDKVTKFVNWFTGWIDKIIPSKESILKAVALEIGPGKIASFLGLNKYFGDADIEAKEIQLADQFDKYTGMRIQADAGVPYTSEAASAIAARLMDSQRELNELRATQGMNPINIFNTDNSQTNNGGGTAVVVEGVFSSNDIANQLRANGILGVGF
jgi:hypothetical protein